MEIILLLSLPVIVILIVAQLIWMLRQNRKGVSHKNKYKFIRFCGVFGLLMTLAVGLYCLFITVNSLPYFCQHTGCQAGGYVYFIGGVVVTFAYLISQVFLLVGRHGLTGKTSN